MRRGDHGARRRAGGPDEEGHRGRGLDPGEEHVPTRRADPGGEGRLQELPRCPGVSPQHEGGTAGPVATQDRDGGPSQAVRQLAGELAAGHAPDAVCPEQPGHGRTSLHRGPQPTGEIRIERGRPQ